VEIFGGDAELPVVIERHTLLLKSLGLGRVFFYVSERNLSCSSMLHFFLIQKYSKNSNIVKYYYNLK